ncbi:MAG: hypothetical protein IT376_08730 [Polyangiaceae bacterium]|nr:hypothetical protein [Polyangiaceae bacterium]
MAAVLVLGMHRSGTSCLAAMLAAGGAAAAGDTVRNWDNARGHHERLELVRLNEDVLAQGGGHWLAPPREVRWTATHARERDRLLAGPVAGLPPLLKDPRTVFTLPFWRASQVPFRCLAVVRHPLAVARSLASWRGVSLAAAIALWSAHARLLLEDQARNDAPLVDFDQPAAAFVAAVRHACDRLGLECDAGALAAAHVEELVHHDAEEPEPLPGLAEALELHRRLAGGAARSTRRRFPRGALVTFEARLDAGDAAGALEAARQALDAVGDRAAVLVPIVHALGRRRAYDLAYALVEAEAPRLEGRLGDLLAGKLLLERGAAAAAVARLQLAAAVARPYHQALHLLPHALRAAGRVDDARAAVDQLAAVALYPHRPLATLAEWSWADGARARAVAELRRAVEAAPHRRRGRLRARLAAWLRSLGDDVGARAELALLVVEDPGYASGRAAASISSA